MVGLIIFAIIIVVIICIYKKKTRNRYNSSGYNNTYNYGNRGNNTNYNTNNNSGQNRNNQGYNTGNSNSTGVVYYATTNKRKVDNLYRFDYKKVGSSWRAYILRMPPLNGRDGSGTVTHRLYDGSQAYVCWNKDIGTKKGAQDVSRVWADNIQQYIETGRRFG